MGYCQVERLRFPLPPCLAQETYAVTGAFHQGRNDCIRAIGRCIRYDDDFQAIARIMLLEFVQHGALDFTLFVVSADQHTDSGRYLRSTYLAAAHTDQQKSRSRIAGIDIEHEQQTKPESDFYQHSASLAFIACNAHTSAGT